MNSLRVSLVTWNVGGAPPGACAGAERLLAVSVHADLIVVGLQEVPLGRRGWKAQLSRALGNDFEYVGGECYAGMHIKVFSRVRNGKLIVPSVSACMKVGAGFGDRFPNKGAVAVVVCLSRSCKVLFVVAHLAANEENVGQREDDWKAIVRRLQRDQFTNLADPRILPFFHQYDHVFFLGDLNYRIVAPGSDKAQRVQWVQQRVAENDWQTLLAKDQLLMQRRAEKVFAGFEEHSISFAPTFKIDPTTGQYSDSRVPSYCDRIMWHSLPARRELVKCLAYEALSSFRESDHVPLHAEFTLSVPVILPPVRPLQSPTGVKVVLEFFLFRFIKRKRFRNIHGTDVSYTTSCSSDTAGHSAANPIAMEPAQLQVGDVTSDQQLLAFQRTEDDEIAIESSSASSDEENDSECSTVHYKLQNDAQPLSGPSTPQVHDSRQYGYNVRLLADMVTAASPASAITSSTEVPFVNTTASSRLTGSPSLPPSGENSVAEEYEFSGINSSSDTSTVQTTTSTLESSADTRLKKRDSLQKELIHSSFSQKKKRRSRLNVMRLHVHGQGMFLRNQVYSVTLPKRVSGHRERMADFSPLTRSFLTIPFEALSSVDDLKFRHLLLELGKKKSNVSTSGVLPMGDLLPFAGRPHSFELPVTKYGAPVGKVEAVIQLTLRKGTNWLDSHGNVIEIIKDRGPSRRSKR